MSNTAEKFKPGDTVVLKSGGPLMTVMENYYPRYECGWFSQNKYDYALFDESVLDRSESPK